MKKRLTSVLCLCLSLLLVILTAATVTSATAEPAETRDEDIINGHSYNRYNNPVRSYLCATEGGYMRVYGSDDGTLLAEYYDSGFHCVGNRFVRHGLDLFGGFYSYGEYYYVLSGRLNPNELPLIETFRVTKFTRDWQEVAHGSLYGANTTVPFDAGRADFAVWGNMMIIRTTHEMYYDAETNANHQANMTIRVSLTDMSLNGSYYDVLNTAGAGYVPHSFNQFVAIDDDGTVVCLDHGDARPRSAVLGRYVTKGDDLIIRKAGYRTYEYLSVMDYYGESGENITGAMIGGLECSSSSYLTVGAAVEQNSAYQRNKAYNAYLSVTDKENFTAEDTRLIYLTDFKEGDDSYASNPQLVKIGSDRFLVMWNEFPVQENSGVIAAGKIYDARYQMKYVFIDGEGNRISDIMTAPAGSMAYVSECEPIVAGDKVMWYVSDGDTASLIAEIAPDGTLTVHEPILPANAAVYPVDLSEANVAFRSFERISDNVEITAENLDDYIVVSFRGRALTRGVDYTLSSTADTPILVDKRSGYISRVGLSLSPVAGRSYLPLVYTYNWAARYSADVSLISAERERDGVHLACYASRGVGYYVYRMSADAPAFEQIARIRDVSTSTYVDTTALYANIYAYQIREFTYDKDGNEILSAPSGMLTVGPAPADWPSEAPTEPPTLPTEPPADPPAQPSEPSVDPTQPSQHIPILGDVDGDHDVTIVDATVIQRCLAGLEQWDRVSADAADADGDGDRTIVDATTIQRWLAGLEKTRPISLPIRPSSDGAGV